MARNNVLKATTNAELLSYIINETPELREEIDLPVQGESTKPIGQLIINNERYKNAFINTVNLIGLTVIKRNLWENPWEVFANRGTLRRGQQIRELIQDLARVYDFNENYDNKARFLQTEVPNVYQYMHELNFQKFYETTINESELQMCFDNEDDGLLTFITDTIANLYETYKYDKYQLDKYQLCRRILDGTIPVKQIKDYASKSPRDILAEMKGVSNIMTFKKPDFNPAGIRKATPFSEQYLILDAEREAINTTNVLATSYFKDEADVKTNFALTDSFFEFDLPRLRELLKDAFIEFTDTEIEKLKTVIGVIISEQWFMDYFYALDNNQNPEGKKQTEWVNPTTLDRNVFLHVWLVLSTSPFENCCVFTTETPEVDSVSVSPSTATVTKGQSIQLKTEVETDGFANKGVFWDINKVAKDNGAVINQLGELKIPSNYKTTGSGTAGVYTITVETALAEGDKISVDGITYTVAAADDTAAKQGAALRSALNVAGITDNYAISGSGANAILTEKSGLYGQVGEPTVVVTTTNGEVSTTETTPGVIPDATIIVTATSVYDNSKQGTAKITVS